MTAYEQAVQAIGDPESFMSRLRQRLHAHDVSHVALARQMEICPTQLSRWMTGRVRPNTDSMLRLDHALDELLYG